MDEISIDRLVLDIPGLDAAQGRELAARVGAGLAGASEQADARYSSAKIDTLAVDLNGLPLNASIPHLAEAIVKALLQQIGGR